MYSQKPVLTGSSLDRSDGWFDMQGILLLAMWW